MPSPDIQWASLRQAGERIHLLLWGMFSHIPPLVLPTAVRIILLYACLTHKVSPLPLLQKFLRRRLRLRRLRLLRMVEAVVGEEEVVEAAEQACQKQQ